MSETYSLSRAQLEHMRLMSQRRELLARATQPWPAKVVAEPVAPVEFMPPSEGGPMAVAMALLTFHAGVKPALVAVIKAHAKKLGISLATLKRAKKAVGLGTIEREDGFYWGLSGGANP
jgi:hypothetical protein